MYARAQIFIQLSPTMTKLMKLFKTSSTDIIQQCHAMFDIKSVSDLILNRKRNFLTKFVNNGDNVVCGFDFHNGRT